MASRNRIFGMDDKNCGFFKFFQIEVCKVLSFLLLTLLMYFKN